MPDQLIDRFTGDDGLITRTVMIRASDAEKREFTGIGVPYEDVIEHWFGREKFEQGSVEDVENARILWQHRDPIGVVVSHEDSAEGMRITGKVSRTQLGDDALTLLRDGVVHQMSIGFEPLEYRVETNEQDGDLIVWTRVRAREFSLVTFPAYENAAVESVRHRQTPNEENNMPTPTLTREDVTAEIAPIREAQEDLQRGLAALQSGMSAANEPAVNIPAGVRTMGDLLKRIADGDKEAIEFHRAYAGGTTADAALEDTFVGDFIRLVRQRRRIINKFSTGALPAKGMNVDYVQLESDGTVVAKQAAEGENLPFGKIKLKRDAAPVETYGGYTDLSLQLIQRSDEPVLTTTLEALGLRYGRETNAVVASEFSTTLSEQLSAYNDATAPDADAAVELPVTRSTDEWLDLIVDAAVNREDKGYAIEGLFVTADIFKQLIRLKDGDNRLMTVYGTGLNQVGELDLKTVSGDLANVTVELLPGVTGDVAAFYDRVAIKTLESPGAPAQLQDENIINLTKQFSVYGHLAVLTPFPDAILPINFATA